MAKLSKKQKRSIAILFVDQVSIPILILATSVFFTTIGLFGANSFTLHGLATIGVATLAITTLTSTIFCKRAIRIYHDTKELDSKYLENLELAGATFAIWSFFSLISQISFILALVLLVISMLIWLITIRKVLPIIRELRKGD